MNRAISPPLHLHVGKKTPVHLHITPKTKKRLSRLEQQQISSTELTAGRPSVRASDSFQSCHHWVSPSSSAKIPWVPPPGKTTRGSMAWEGPTHRLEIHPDCSGMSVMVQSEQELGRNAQEYEKKVRTLRKEVEHLRAEVNHQNCLHACEVEETEMDLREKEAQLAHCQDKLLKSEIENVALKHTLSRSRSPSPNTRRPSSAHRVRYNLASDLHKKEAELAQCEDELLKKELENVALKHSLSRSPSPRRPSTIHKTRDADELRRKEEFLAQLAIVEAESQTVTRHANKLKACIKKLLKDRRFVSVHALHFSECKDVFLACLSQFERSNKELKRLVEAEQIREASGKQMKEYQDLLEKKLAMTESANQVLREKLEEQEKASLLSKQLHEEIGQREGAIQSLHVRIQTLEEELQQREERYAQMQSELTEVKSEKEVLKQLSRHQKDRAMQNEQTLQSVGSQLDEANAEFVRLQNKLSKSNKELMSNEGIIESLQEKVLQLETLLAQTRMTAKVSMDAVSDQLAEKTRELTSVQMEADRLKSMLKDLETRLHDTDNINHNKICGLQQEVSHLNTSMSHCECVASEYKLQLKQSKADYQELSKELELKEKEIDQLKREAMLNCEKERLKFQQQLAELEHMPELLKSSEQRLAETQGRLLSHEQRCGEQSRLLAELSVKAEQSTTMVKALKDQLKEASSELRAVEGRLASAEDQKEEAEKQRRELMGISGRKEEMVQRLQGRVEELVRDTASLSAQLETAKADMRRQNELVRERAASKERANVTRINDLESQLNRANTLATQFRKSKDDLERRYHSRIHELQDRLEQANSTKRSLENYITFLKSSYASVFSDSHHVPGSPIATPSLT